MTKRKEHFLCKIGLHWKMKIKHCLFIDRVSNEEVFEAVCPCGRCWMITNIFGLPIFKVEHTHE